MSLTRRVTIVVVEGPDTGLELPLASLVALGRDPAGDVVLADPQVSQRHFAVEPGGEAGVIRDLGSTNGTFVNGRRIEAPHRLGPGDKIQAGDTVLEVRLLAVAESVDQVTRPSAGVPPLPVTRPRAGVPPAAPGAAPPPAAPPPNSIEVEGLVRDFKGSGRAVDGVDLTVDPGEIYGFLGPNGAGKSTTVHMLTTLLAPTAGTARVAGYDIVSEGPSVRASIGVALQEAALDPLLNSWEHMELQTALQGVPKSERKGRAEELIERVGLTEAASRKVGGYSGGMKRRLDLALALVHTPRVVFLDEPTTGLDPKSRNDLWEEVARLSRDEGVTVFLTTQYLEEADLLAGRVGIIEGGKIVAEGTPDQLKAEIGRPTVEAVPYDESERVRLAGVLERFGSRSAAAHKGVAVRLSQGIDDLTEIVRALDSEGLRITNLSLHAPTLDDVFLAKTGRTLEDSVEEAERMAQASRTQISLPGQPIIRPE